MPIFHGTRVFSNSSFFVISIKQDWPYDAHFMMRIPLKSNLSRGVSFQSNFQENVIKVWSREDDFMFSVTFLPEMISMGSAVH